MKPLLSVTRQRIAPAELCQLEWSLQYVVDRGKYAYVCERDVKYSICIYWVEDMSSTALFGACMLVKGSAQSINHCRVEHGGQNDISITVERVFLTGVQRCFGNSALVQEVIEQMIALLIHNS